MTVTTTIRRTTTSTIVVTTTKVEEPEEELPEFSCIPMSVTNSVGAVLELGDDCGLEYDPPSDNGGTATTSSGGSTRTAEVEGRQALHPAEVMMLPRETVCTPYTTVSTTVTSTIPATTSTTTTTTVTIEPSEEGFSCPAMSVTNAAGDELALNDKCELEFTPAQPTTTSSAGGSQGGGGGGVPGAASRVPSVVVVFGLTQQYIVAIGVVGLLLAW
jgi:hypothetical protein